MMRIPIPERFLAPIFLLAAIAMFGYWSLTSVSRLINSSRVLRFQETSGVLTSALALSSSSQWANAGMTGRVGYDFIVAGERFSGSTVLVDDAPLVGSVSVARWQASLAPGQLVPVFYSASDPADCALSQEALPPDGLEALLAVPALSLSFAMFLRYCSDTCQERAGVGSFGQAEWHAAAKALGLIHQIFIALGGAAAIAIIPSVVVMFLAWVPIPSSWDGLQRTCAVYTCWAGIVVAVGVPFFFVLLRRYPVPVPTPKS